MEPSNTFRLLASELGYQLTPIQFERLERYLVWLQQEAIPGGGLGPNESGNLLDRHVLDALTILAPLTGGHPESLLDLGSGVGLPGIPLAIVLPTTVTTLVDRSGRRCALMARAVRVLDLENVTVEQSDLAQLDRGAELVVSRASLPPGDLLPHLRRLTMRLAVVAGSTVAKPIVDGYETMKIVSRYLDSPRWLLIMRAT